MPSNEAYVTYLYSNKNQLIGQLLAKKDIAGAFFHQQQARIRERLDRR